jgi:hypothetical protein
MEDIRSDNLYNKIPSVATGKGWYVHARGDHPEIRAKFFELLRRLDGFKTYIVIAKKDLNIFNRKHNNNPTEFYFDVLHHLLSGRIKNDDCQYNLYLSQRGNNSLNRFQEAVSKALATSGDVPSAADCVLEIVAGKEMPELSIVDYLIWAVQRNLIHGEDRYLDALRNKYEMIVDIYDETGTNKKS